MPSVFHKIRSLARMFQHPNLRAARHRDTTPSTMHIHIYSKFQPVRVCGSAELLVLKPCRLQAACCMYLTALCPAPACQGDIERTKEKKIKKITMDVTKEKTKEIRLLRFRLPVQSRMTSCVVESSE